MVRIFTEDEREYLVKRDETSKAFVRIVPLFTSIYENEIIEYGKDVALHMRTQSVVDSAEHMAGFLTDAQTLARRRVAEAS